MEKKILNMMFITICAIALSAFLVMYISIQVGHTNVLLASLVEVEFRQHLDDIGIWPEPMLRRFALGYEIQRDAHIWDTEEWEKILSNDLPSYFHENPQAITIWENGFRQYWTQDVQKFMDDVIAKSKTKNFPFR